MILNGRKFASIGLGLSLLVLSTGSGCALIYQMVAGDGTMIEPLFDGLSGKRVAVVCIVNSTSYGAETAGEQISRQVGNYLRQNVDGIDVVRSEDVSDWIDNNNWNEGDFVEVGRGVNADLVVAVEVNSLRLHDGQTLFKGQAAVTTRVYDTSDKHRLVFDMNDPDYAFPKGHGVPTTDRTEASFRRVFIQELGHHIAKKFYPHPLAEDFAADAVFYAH